MAGREKHIQRSQRSCRNKYGAFASYANRSMYKSSQKEQRKSMFEGIKNAFSKMFHKNKEG